MRVDVGAAAERAAGLVVSDNQTRAAFADFAVDSGPWEWFATLTFDDKRLAERGVLGWDRAGWGYGDRATRRWMDARGRRAGFMRFREANERGGWHFHVLVNGVGNQSRKAAWADWFDSHGLARIEPIEGSRSVALYVAKYVTKDRGEIAWKLQRSTAGPGFLQTQGLTSWASS